MARIERKDENDRHEIDKWFDHWSRRQGFPSGFGFDIFEGFEERFRRDWEQINRLMHEATRGDLPTPDKGGPYVYGWSLRIGPDGRPHFEEFGNVPQERQIGSSTETIKRREPLVDVMEEDEIITITAEVPGVDKNDINLEITEESLYIKVDQDEHKYYKEVKLPAEVDQDSATASYRNGILDIELKKTKKTKQGKKIHLD